MLQLILIKHIHNHNWTKRFCLLNYENWVSCPHIHTTLEIPQSALFTTFDKPSHHLFTHLIERRAGRLERCVEVSEGGWIGWTKNWASSACWEKPLHVNKVLFYSDNFLFWTKKNNNNSRTIDNKLLHWGCANE